MSKETVLILKDVAKEYRQGRSTIEVLKSINLQVMAGEMVAIVGNSGSGKSTLLHIAGLLDKVDSGQVTIAPADFLTSDIPNDDNLRLKYLGFIYQYHHLLKDFNARENVALPALIAGGNYQKALEEADSLLETLGLGNRIYNMPGELSGGEQQRVAIGRALINKPKIILADEPTGNLDPTSAMEVFNLFLKISQSYNTAIIMVTHNHMLAAKMQKVYELKYGLLQLSPKLND